MTRPSSRSMRPEIEARFSSTPATLAVKRRHMASSSCGRRQAATIVGDVRAVGEQRRVERPDGGEGRVVEAQPAVRAEHRDALAEVVEGLALHADQRVVAAFQVEPLGDVLVDPGHAALRMGIGDDAQRLPVGQVPPVLARFRRAVGRQQLVPPAAEVGLLGQLAAGPQPVEHGHLVGGRIEEGGIEAEQRAIGGVGGLQPPVGAEDGDRRLQLVERAGVELDLAAERRLGALDLGRVDGDAGAAALRGDVGDIEDAPRAGDDGRQAAGEDRACRRGRRRSSAGRWCRAVRGRAPPPRRHPWPRRRRHRRR